MTYEISVVPWGPSEGSNIGTGASDSSLAGGKKLHTFLQFPGATEAKHSLCQWIWSQRQLGHIKHFDLFAL
jgi:hypothetical protein